MTDTKLKTSLKAIGIGGLAVTATLLFNPGKDNSIALRGQSFAPEEYGQIKGQMIEKFKDKDTELMSFPELQAWGAITDKEMRKCKPKTYKIKSIDDLLNQFNSVAEKGCK